MLKKSLIVGMMLVVLFFVPLANSAFFSNENSAVDIQDEQDKIKVQAILYLREEVQSLLVDHQKTIDRAFLVMREDLAQINDNGESLKYIADYIVAETSFADEIKSKIDLMNQSKLLQKNTLFLDLIGIDLVKDAILVRTRTASFEQVLNYCQRAVKQINEASKKVN